MKLVYLYSGNLLYWDWWYRDDLTYTVTVSPPAQLSATVLTSTSVTAQYNVDYTVSVVATNCAGNGTNSQYNIRIGKLTSLFGHLQSFNSGGCRMLTNPTNGALGLVSSRLPGSTVTIQCDAGYVSAIVMVTCESTLMWSPDPDIECTLLTQPPPTLCKLFFGCACGWNFYNSWFLQLLLWTAQLHYTHQGMALSVIIQYQLFPVHDWPSNVMTDCLLRGYWLPPV